MKNTLRVRRAERRVSQRALAATAGIQPDRFWRIENGYATPTDAERLALAEALRVTEAEIWPELAERRAASQPAA